MRVGLAALLLLLSGGLSACGTTGSPLPYTAGPRAAAPAPSPASAPAGPAAAGPGAQCVPRRSEQPLGALTPPGAHAQRVAEIERRRVLRVGVVAEARPFASMNWHTGVPEGFEIELAREIARAIFGNRSRVEIHAVDTRDREKALAEGEVDIVIGTMTMTCERKEKVNFSGVYFEASFTLLVSRSSGLSTVADLSGRRVCSSQGSTSIGKILNLPGFPEDRPEPVPVSRVGSADCLAALQRGEVDAVASDDTILAGMEQQDPTVRVLGREAFAGASAAELATLDEPYGMAVARTDLGLTGLAAEASRKADSDLVAFLNRMLLDMFTDGRWQQLYADFLSDVPGIQAHLPTERQPHWPDGQVGQDTGPLISGAG